MGCIGGGIFSGGGRHPCGRRCLRESRVGVSLIALDAHRESRNREYVRRTYSVIPLSREKYKRGGCALNLLLRSSLKPNATNFLLALYK